MPGKNTCSKHWRLRCSLIDCFKFIILTNEKKNLLYAFFGYQNIIPWYVCKPKELVVNNSIPENLNIYMSCICLPRYQQMLHRNLVYLATIADSNQNMQQLLTVSITYGTCLIRLNSSPCNHRIFQPFSDNQISR